MLLIFVTAFVTVIVMRYYYRYLKPAIVKQRVAVSESSDSSASPPLVRMVSATSQASFPDTPSTPRDGAEPFSSRFLDDFEPVRNLGSGGFGVVFEARNRLDGASYAVKRVAVVNSETAKEKVMREVRALAKLDHSGIVRYYQSWIEAPPIAAQRLLDQRIRQACGDASSGTSQLKSWDNLDDLESLPPLRAAPTTAADVTDSLSVVFAADSDDTDDAREAGCSNAALSQSDSCRTKDMNVQTRLLSRRIHLYIQMQLCLDATLQHWLVANTSAESRPRAQMLDWFAQVVGALNYVHSSGLIHRDLKPSNIFFAQDGQLKIGDFGLATESLEESYAVETESFAALYPSLHTGNVGTTLYMSPEQIAGLPYTSKVDIYSLGLVLVELLKPFQTQMERIQTLSAIRQQRFPDLLDSDSDAQFVRWLADGDADMRPSCEEVALSPLLRDYLAPMRRTRSRTLTNISTDQ